ncbi:MAG: sulfite exporter TauE/SafE family protein [Candidatus Omnitrophica bacterium]|nr:sulfite exporter TauE/SafE family protein [Candidatus Omnitrophota bacterium]
MGTFVFLAAVGMLGGVVSGTFGVGGGVVFIPLLVLFRYLGPHQAIATSLAVIVPTTIVALSRHSLAGMTDWKTAGILAVFAIVGAWIGAGISLELSGVLLRRLFAVCLLILSFRMFFAQ